MAVLGGCGAGGRAAEKQSSRDGIRLRLALAATSTPTGASSARSFDRVALEWIYPSLSRVGAVLRSENLPMHECKIVVMRRLRQSVSKTA